jgi:hypothetical protein
MEQKQHDQRRSHYYRLHLSDCDFNSMNFAPLCAYKCHLYVTLSQLEKHAQATVSLTRSTLSRHIITEMQV